MTREILVKIKTDHDDTLRAVQSVVANLTRAGYVATGPQIQSLKEEPFSDYRFVTRHADVEAMEIDLHIEQVREEAANAENPGQVSDV